MIALLLPTDKINLMLLFQVAFTVDVTATIALPFVGLWYVDVFNTIVSIVFRAMMLLVFYLCATMHNHAQFRKVAPIMLSASWVGLMVGIVFGQNLYTTFENHSMVLTVITVIVLYLVFMASSVFTVMRKHQANESSELPEKARTMEDVEAEACRAIALRYSLSDRETEVLGYLIKGRSATFISGELYLSINTVKSYMKTLYAKLDVHSKQELINLVEATSSAATSAVDASR
jgi:DNA-binding CsgD family transcriptional regulator/F0F1-type ATP synthase assembly protein I